MSAINTTSKRITILNAIVDTLKPLTSLKSVQSAQGTVPDLDVSPIPCAFVHAGAMTSITNTTEHLRWEMDLLVSVWASGDNIELLFVDVYNKLLEDYTLGGLIEEITLYTLEPYSLPNDVYGGVLTFKVQFRHVRMSLA